MRCSGTTAALPHYPRPTPLPYLLGIGVDRFGSPRRGPNTLLIGVGRPIGGASSLLTSSEATTLVWILVQEDGGLRARARTRRHLRTTTGFDSRPARPSSVGLPLLCGLLCRVEHSTAEPPGWTGYV